MHAVVPESSAIIVAPMAHLEEAQCPDDDWTGLRDRAERRKRQNRLNVRAHRKRRALESRQREEANSQGAQPQPRGTPSQGCDSTPSLQILQWAPPITPSTKPSNRASERKRSPESSSDEERSQASHHRHNFQPAVRSPSRRPSSQHRPKAKLPSKIPPYYQNPNRWFTLYRDHLIPLVYYNVFRATVTNIRILSLTCLLENPCTPDLHTTPLFPSPSQVPPTLLPTALQSSTPHEAWIDIFPSGAMRDNAIRHRDNIDHHELCSDLVGCQVGMCRDQPGIIAWSDPWHPDGWEVTEKFVEKWSFLLKGCDDVMRATNRWRATRDEEPLVWELE